MGIVKIKKCKMLRFDLDIFTSISKKNYFKRYLLFTFWKRGNIVLKLFELDIQVDFFKRSKAIKSLFESFLSQIDRNSRIAKRPMQPLFLHCNVLGRDAFYCKR